MTDSAVITGGIHSDGSYVKVLEIITAQHALIEEQTRSQLEAAERYAAQAVECEKLRISNEALTLSNEQKTQAEKTHIAVHEKQTAEIVFLLEETKRLIVLMESVCTLHIKAVDNLAQVITTIFAMQGHTMSDGSRDQIARLLAIVNNGIAKSGVELSSGLHVHGDVNAGHDAVISDK